MKQSVSSNTFYLISAFVGQKILSFIFFTLIARLFGVSTTGSYVFALSYTTFFGVFIDIGFSPFLIREVARDRTQAQKLLQNILGAKLLLSLLAVIVVIATVPLMNKSVTADRMVYLAAIIMVIDSLTLAFWGVLRGYQNLKYEAVNVVVSQLIIMLIGIVVFWAKFSSEGLIIAVLAGSLWQFFSGVYFLKKKLKLSIRPRFDKAYLATIFKISWPFGLSQVLTRFYSYLDQVLLGLMVGEHDLGLYSVPYKITFAMQFIPQSLGIALFPALSDIYINDKPRLSGLFEEALRYLTIIAIPVSFGIAVLAEPVVLKIYGPIYTQAIPALQFMMIGLIFIFLNFPVGAFLNSVGRQAQQTFNLGLTLISNALINIVLIPHYSFMASSLAVVVSMAVLFFSGIWRVSQEISWSKQGFLKTLFKTLLSGVIMALAVSSGIQWQGVKDFGLVHFLIFPFFGALIYFGGLVLFGELTRQDVAAVKKIILKR